MPHSFAYLFERFPSFIQTFVYREAVEMVRQEMAPWLVSIRRPEDPADLAETLNAEVFYLPEPDAIRAEVDDMRQQCRLVGRVHRAIPRGRKEKDSNRMFEAAWLGPRLKRQGIRHVHAQFGSMATRTAWWLRKLHGITYSFTGHANDIFCENDFPVSNSDLVRDAKFVVTVTDYARLWMENRHPAARGKIFRVYNGIDNDFPPRKPEQKIPRILSVGRYVEKKGFSDLIEACRILRDQNPGRPFECLIVGGGPLEAELKRQVQAAGLQDTVSLMGPRSQGEVRQQLSMAQLFVLPCVPEVGGGSDNLPTVIMEAMMCGVPIISTRIAGVPEMIEDGKTGILLEPHAPAAIAASMDKLLWDSVLADQFSVNALNVARNTFAIENTTRDLKFLLVQRAGVVPPRQACELDPELPNGIWQRWFGGNRTPGQSSMAVRN